MPQPLAQHVDGGHDQHRDGSQGQADPRHQRDGHHETQQLARHDRRKCQVHLHRADVGVGAGDDLAGVHPVVERERQPAEVGEQQRAQLELDPVAHREESVAVHEGGNAAGEAEPHENDDQRPQRARGRAVGAGHRRVDGVASNSRSDSPGARRHDGGDHCDHDARPLASQQRSEPTDPAQRRVGADPIPMVLGLRSGLRGRSWWGYPHPGETTGAPAGRAGTNRYRGRCHWGARGCTAPA